MNRIIEWRGKPSTIRVDNVPEYIGGTLLEWAEKPQTTIRHIQPGQPQHRAVGTPLVRETLARAHMKRYNRTLRHEWLDQYGMETIEAVQDFTTQWHWTDNTDRPNMGIGGITPAQNLKRAAYVLRTHPAKSAGITVGSHLNCPAERYP